MFIGMSKRIPGIRAGEQIVRCHDGFAIFVFCGKDSEIGWFVVDKLDRRYQYPEKPAYSTTDNIRFCESIGDTQIWDKVHFSDIFNARTSFSTALVEENVFQTWHHGRIVCIGDSISKVGLQKMIMKDTDRVRQVQIQDSAQVWPWKVQPHLQANYISSSTARKESRLMLL